MEISYDLISEKIQMFWVLCFSSVAQSCPTLCDLMNCMQHARLPVLQYFPEFAQTPIHWASDAIQPSHPLSPRSTLALSLFQHQGLFQWAAFSYQVAKVLELQYQWKFRADFLQNGLVGSPCSPSDSQDSFPTPQFKTISSSALSFLHSPTLTSIHDHWKNHSLE